MSNASSNIPVVSIGQFIDMAVAHFSEDKPERDPIGILGDTGGGKTSACFEVAYRLGLTREQILLKRPANHTVVDYIGCPTVEDGKTFFNPPEFVHNMMSGAIKMVIWDELPDCINSVQNLLAAPLLDFHIDTIKLNPNLMQMWTGNKVEHRAGSNEVNRKISTRSSMFEAGRSLDSWVKWGIENGMPKDLLAFVYWKGEEALYGKPDANNRDLVRVCPRQVAKVGSTNEELYPGALYSLKAQSYVPAWWVAEYTGFKKLADELPSISEIKSSPATAPISNKIEVVYALVSRLITEVATVGDFQKLMQYVTRLRVEPQTLFVNAVYKNVPEIDSCREYTNWAITNSPYFGAV